MKLEQHKSHSEGSARENVKKSLDELDRYIGSNYRMDNLHKMTPQIESWIDGIFDKADQCLNSAEDVVQRKTFLTEIVESYSRLIRMRSPGDYGEPVGLKRYVSARFDNLLSKTEEQNYLLFLQYQAIREDKYYLRMDRYNKYSPMVIAGGIYIANTDSGIKISLPEDRQYLDTLNNELVSAKSTVSSFLNAQSSWGGSGSVDDLRYGESFQSVKNQYDQKINEVKEYFASKAVPLEEVAKKLVINENDQVENDLKAFSTLTHQVIWEKLNELFSFQNIERPEDVFYFLRFANIASKEEILRAQEYTEKYGQYFIKLFLSLVHGGEEMGKKILILGEKLPEEPAKILFGKYSEMIEAADLLENLLLEEVAGCTPEMIKDARNRLLLRGKELLERYSEIANQCQGEDCIRIGEELQEKLSLAKASIFAFSAACRTLVDRGQFTFEDFKKAQLLYDASPLPEQMREQIISMHKENTKQYPEGLREYWRGTLRQGLEVENTKQMVVSVQYDDTVVATMRVIEQEDGSWYGASFNVNSTVMGSRIGTELLKEVIKNLSKDKPFVADCYSENPMLSVYTEKFGFQITKTYENYENTGAKVFQITLFPDSQDSAS